MDENYYPHFDNDLAYRESEKQVIGGLLVNPELLEKYVDILSREDFTDTYYSQLFYHIKELWNENRSIDYAVLMNACKVIPDSNIIICDCAECFVSSSTYPEHVKFIKNAARNRRIKSKVEEIIKYGDYNINSLQNIIDSEQNHNDINSITDRNTANINEFVENLNKPKSVIYTGFSELDRKLCGLRRGTLFVIGARPSTGKTTFALNIAKNQLRLKNRVVFFSLEMKADMIFEKLAADVCGIDSRLFAQNKLSEQNIASVKGLMKSVENGKKLYVIDDTYTIESICSGIYAEKADVVIIDYVQRVRSVRDFKTERERINRITSELKIAAKKTNTCIILLSQIARMGKEAPRMSDLKESGALEEDGDYIAILHRPFVLDKTDTSYSPEETTLLLDKNKFGECGAIAYNFNLPLQRFTETEYFHK